MSTFHALWTNYANRAGFKTLNAFITKHDPSASAYQTTTRKLSAMPARARVIKWSKLLKLSADETKDFVRVADFERVLCAKDGEELGPGITILMDRILDLENSLTERQKECGSLAAQLAEIRAECARQGVSLGNAAVQG